MDKIRVLNSVIYPLICKVVNMFSLRVSTKGKRNCLKINAYALMRKSKVVVRGCNNNIVINAKCRCRNCFIEIWGDNNCVEIGEGVMVYEKAYISIKGDNCRMRIGDKTTIGSAKFFMEESNTSIVVGEDCMLGRDVCMQTTDFHSILDMTTHQRINPPQNVSIGNHVWIGFGVTIGKGGEVGSNSVVGEKSLVTKAFTQKHVCIAGTPAKVLRENIDWSRDKL